MAMPFTTPFSPAQSDARTKLPCEEEELSRDADAKGLEDAPETKKPRTLWEKIKHSFDYGSTGEQG